MKAFKIVIALFIVLFFISGKLAIANSRHSHHSHHSHSNVSIGLGFGYPGFYGGYYGGYGHHWGHHRGSSVFIGGYWPIYPNYYDYYDYGYYAPAPPSPPVIAAPPAQAPQSSDNYALYDSLRVRKGELLKTLSIGDKEHRTNAINELAGYSFDDNVRSSIENVLFSDSDPELRIAAANALGQVKNPKAIPALEKARVQDSITDVRAAADQSIRKIQQN